MPLSIDPVLSNSVEIFTGFIILVTFSSVEVQPGSGEITFFHPYPNLSDSVGGGVSTRTWRPFFIVFWIYTQKVHRFVKALSIDLEKITRFEEPKFRFWPERNKK